MSAGQHETRRSGMEIANVLTLEDVRRIGEAALGSERAQRSASWQQFLRQFVPSGQDDCRQISEVLVELLIVVGVPWPQGDIKPEQRPGHPRRYIPDTAEGSWQVGFRMSEARARAWL